MSVSLASFNYTVKERERESYRATTSFSADGKDESDEVERDDDG